MEIVRTRDMRLANKILTDPTIADAVSAELTGKYYPTNRGGYIYLTSYIENNPIGLFIIHPNSYQDWICHVQVLPQYRKQYAESFGKKVIQWVWDNSEIPYLLAEISLSFPNVKDFALLQGFYIQGIIGNSWSLRRDKD